MEIEKKLNEWHEILIKSGNYSDLNLSSVRHCLDLADHILDFYVIGGKILKFDKFGNEEDSLNPLQLSHLEKNSWWFAHYVATDLENIYCPILGWICKVQDYSREVFGEEIESKFYAPSCY